jgi:NADH-quinone oxidoreductase subunit N
MTDIGYLAIAPVLALTAGVVILLLAEVALKPSKNWWAIIGGGAVVAAFGLSVAQWIDVNDSGSDRLLEAGAELGSLSFNGMIAFDPFNALVAVVLTVITGLGLVIAWPLIITLGRRGAEFVALILLALAGLILMAASAHFLMLFLSLEVASISLYVLAGFTRSADSNEAAVKYFLLGSFASAIFLYGVAMTYAATGSLSIYGAVLVPTAVTAGESASFLAGIGLLVVGLGFKVSAAPFHMWAPDVYQGAASGISGYMAAGAKVAGFAALARIVASGRGLYLDDWSPAIAVIAAVSILIGTVLAIAQTDIKRMLAYSSVAHAGFILTGLVAGGDGVPYVLFYVITYAFQLLGAFAVVSIVSGFRSTRSQLGEYAGLAQRSPVVAGALALLMIAMGGIPLTAGFTGKLGVFQAAVGAGYLWLVVVAVVAAVAGLFFYLRVIVLMFMQPRPAEAPGAAPADPVVTDGLRLALTVVAVVTIAFGIVPDPLLDVVTDALPL